MNDFVMPEHRARALRELRRREEIEGTAGGPGAIPEEMTFRQWCEHLGEQGLLIDQKPFRLDNRPALLPIYDAIPATRAEAAGRTLVVQKATQLGLTVWETLADIYMAKKWAPLNIGMFLPDGATPSFKSQHRFMPIVRSSPLLYRDLVAPPPGEGSSRPGDEGNIMTRVLGRSLLMFLWTSGKISTESRPMDVVSLDEVQGMALDQIDKVRVGRRGERWGDSVPSGVSGGPGHGRGADDLGSHRGGGAAPAGAPGAAGRLGRAADPGGRSHGGPGEGR